MTRPNQRRARLRTLLYACALAAPLALSGCPKKPRVPGLSKEPKVDVRFNVSPLANGGSPVAVDILLVSDKELLKELKKMTATDWFARREQIILDHPKEQDLLVLSREWVPGQVVEPARFTVGRDVRAGVVFANYFGPGEHRAVLDPRARDVRITLGEEKLEVVSRR